MSRIISGLVTVVIPVFKVEEYLDRCVKSVVDQTYRNLEIILVDDGSPDACPAICDAWAKKDSRIRVIHKQNEGLGYARNTGIENANGEYICFFDSDDYVASTLVEECCKEAFENKADIVSFGNIDITKEGEIFGERIPSPPKCVYAGTEIKEMLSPRLISYNTETGENWNMLLSACCSMISMRLVKQANWRFVSEREIISEDFYSMFELYQFAERVVFIRKGFYYYTVNPKSLSRSYRKDRYQKVKQLAFAMTALGKQYGCNVEKEIQTMFLGTVMNVFRQIVSSGEKTREKQECLRKILIDEYLQKTVSLHNAACEEYTKKILFWAMRRKLTGLCYFLAWARNLKG